MLHFAKFVVAIVLLLGSISNAQETAPTVQQLEAQRLEDEFQNQVRPLLGTHCLACHDEKTQEASLSLESYTSFKQVIESHPVWEAILERVEAGEMPPADSRQPLEEKDRQTLIHWIKTVRQFEASRHAGDPGVVLARRLSNAEYDYSIRDLTGVDIRPTETFPVDPANEAGFDNSGESLTISPALMSKYLEAARHTTDHLVFAPSGLIFAPHPVMTDTDRDKYCVRRIVEFYQQQPTDIAQYFLAAWKYRYRKDLKLEEQSLPDFARSMHLSPNYLQLVWEALQNSSTELGPLERLGQMWRDLPKAVDKAAAIAGCQQMRDYVLRVRQYFEATVDNLKIEGVHAGAQPFVLWKNRQYAAQRQHADFAWLATATDAESQGAEKREEKVDADRGFALPTAAQREAFEQSCRTFCRIFPDAFFVAERGRDYVGKPKAEQEKGRLLSAGFHSMMGYFRDDQPLYDLVLDESGREELDRLWQELDAITAAPLRQYQGFLWFERTDSKYMRDPEFDFARPEDKEALTEPLIEKLAEVYLAKAIRNGGTEVPLQAIRTYFQEINKQICWFEQARLAAESKHLKNVIDFAQRAYRRPLTVEEASGLTMYYQRLRADEGLSHEEAIQDTIVSVLMSPHFIYRLDLLSDSDQPRPLTGFELASRLSYFLWSSLPDAELLECAASDALLAQDVLRKQVSRMLRDDRVRGLATEFGGNWLDFRRFEEHNSVDRDRFPSFNDALRQAMFEEPVRFLVDLIQHDRPLLDLLYADRTFVNQMLAAHYGMTELSIVENQWVPIEQAAAYGRGGLLPMAVFLTKNAPGLRTSPVKRGYWVVRRLLGERIPAPPPNVPDLPTDESQLGELTLRETLAKHRDHASCAGCHNRIDSIGLVFEGYGPIGERRKLDLGGRPVDTTATFPDGSQRDGLVSLREYLRENRQEDFVDNACRKLLSYALGRSLLLSDESLLTTMREELASHEYRFHAMVNTIVTSSQFLRKRGRDAMQIQTDKVENTNVR